MLACQGKVFWKLGGGGGGEKGCLAILTACLMRHSKGQSFWRAHRFLMVMTWMFIIATCGCCTAPRSCLGLPAACPCSNSRKASAFPKCRLVACQALRFSASEWQAQHHHAWSSKAPDFAALGVCVWLLLLLWEVTLHEGRR